VKEWIRQCYRSGSTIYTACSGSILPRGGSEAVAAARRAVAMRERGKVERWRRSETTRPRPGRLGMPEGAALTPMSSTP
jgi:hypothetical protein